MSQSATERSRVAALAWRRPGHWCPRPSDCPPVSGSCPIAVGAGEGVLCAASYGRGCASRPQHWGWEARQRRGVESQPATGSPVAMPLRTLYKGARGASHGQRHLLRTACSAAPPASAHGWEEPAPLPGPDVPRQENKAPGGRSGSPPCSLLLPGPRNHR